MPTPPTATKHYTDRIEIVLDLVRSLSQAAKPDEVLRVFATGMVQLNGPSGFISLSCRDTEPGEYRITRLLTDDNVLEIHKIDPWGVINRPKAYTGGLLGQIIAADRPTVINDLNVTDDPVLGHAVEHYRSLLAVPLFEKGEALNWGIQLRREPDAFDTDDVEDMLLRSNLVGNTVRHVRTAAELKKANRTIREEIDRIADIQRALLPEKLPDIPGLELAVDYQTFDRAGGDMYFFHEMGTHPDGEYKGEEEPDGRWGILIGDVSGHGPAAAVVMAMVESMLGGFPENPTRAGEVLEYLNRRLCAKRIDTTFVTMFLMFYDTATRELTYARAGHPPPLWRKGSGPDATGRPEVEQLDAVGGLPLGIIPNEDYPDAKVTLEPGHTVVLYTDGISETRSPDRQFFGARGIVEAAHQCEGDAQCAVNTIRNSVRFHERGGRPQDDQTVLIMRVE